VTDRKVETALVLGTGTMGQGIAQLCAAAGIATRVFDANPEQVKKALEGIEKITDRLVQKDRLTAAARTELLGNLAAVDGLEAGAADIDLVIEAVPEKMDLKVELLGRVAAAAPKHAILASNTSSLSITEMGTRLDAGPRTVGLHFFNPPPVMKLLEIVRSLHTSEETVTASLELAERLGKTAIVVSDTPGFATSRLGLAIGAEAMRMLEAGVAGVADIDRAMELGYRHPMGPLKLSDLVGLDVRLSILEHLHREIGEQFRPPSILRQMVRAGRTGKKSGEGFYRWTEDGPVPTEIGKR